MPLTDKQIRKLSTKRLLENTDIVTISILYFFSTATLIVLSESFITAIIRIFSDERYSIFRLFSYYKLPLNMFFLILRVTLYYIILSLTKSILLRYFIIMNDSEESDRFVRLHWGRLLGPSLKGSLALILYKMMVSAPLAIGIYGILHFRTKSLSVQLSLLDLVCFMLCIGFSIVWFGELVHYFISLSLVKYIFAINPRANFFNACDLSVKLMDGRHMRVIHFWIGLIPYMLPGLLLYPLAVIYPYVAESRLLLAKEIMGSYWQDKIPAMARRWERQQERLKRP